MCRSLAESLWFTANENDPKNQYIHTYICSLECLLSFVSMRILAQLRILLLGCGPASPFLFYFISFFFYSAARDAILYLFKRSTRLRMLPKSGHTLCTWCRRALHATFLRLLDSDDLWARRLRIWWSSSSGRSTWHWLPTPFHLPNLPNLRWQAIKIAILECSTASPLIVKTPCHSTLSRQQHFSSSSKGTQRTPEVERRIGRCCSTRWSKKN